MPQLFPAPGINRGNPTPVDSVASLAINLTNGGTTVFSVDKTGIVSLGSAAVGTISPTNIHLNFTGGSIPAMGVGNDGVGNAVVVLPSLGRLAWNSTNSISVNNADLLLFRDAAGTLAQRNGVNAQKLRLYSSFTDASNGAWAEIDLNTASTAIIGTNGNGTGAATLSKLQLNVLGVNKGDYGVTTAGVWTFAGALTTPSYLGSAVPTTASGTTYTVAATDSDVIFTNAGTCTATLPAAASFGGRILWVKTTGGGSVVSATSNVVPKAGGAAGTAILAATAGTWARLKSDSTNWIVTAGT